MQASVVIASAHLPPEEWVGGIMGGSAGKTVHFRGRHGTLLCNPICTIRNNNKKSWRYVA